MASAAKLCFFHLMISNLISTTIASPSSSSIIQELNQPRPPDFGAVISTNCLRNPTLRYCNSTSELDEIFKFTTVEKHLCLESKNPNCPDGLTKIEIHENPRIAVLYLSFSFFWKFCPLTVVGINLSNNSLKGQFPIDLLQCSMIQSLDLQHNQLFGELPIDRFEGMNNLTFLNLSYNRFSESDGIGLRFLLSRFDSSSFVHSGILPIDHDHRLQASTTIFLLLAVLFFIVSTVGFIGWLFLSRPDFLPSCLRPNHKFTHAMIIAATDKFSPDNLISRDEKEEWYKGVLRNGTETWIVIKRGRISVESHQVFDEKCRLLVQLDHRNLAKVLGWCNCRELRAVLAVKPAGVESVEEWLLRSPPWKQRVKVIRRVLDLISYLQEEGPEVGYDLRIHNVMLAEELQPLISKFRIEDHSSEARRVYRFGIFCLEMVVDNRKYTKSARDEKGFAGYMKIHYPKYLRNVTDEKMKLDSASYEQLKQVTGVGITCIDPSAEHPPSILQISAMFKKILTSTSVPTSVPRPRDDEKRREQKRC